MATSKGAITKISERSGAFAVVFLFLFAVTFGFLSFVGATPDAPNTPQDTSQNTQPTQPQTQPSNTNTANQNGGGEEPVRVVAKDIGLDINVVNPTSTDVNDLDTELTKGTVRYPTSGLLGQNGTVLIFGHSSYLPVIIHQYYKEFDGIQNLKNGDIVSVYSNDRVYNFSVTGVRTADATDQNDNVIELPNDAQYLTLVTCDSFATKSNRFIVTASFVDSQTL